jgi:hypothetical protein
MPAHDPGIVHGEVERPAVGTIEERNTELMLSLDDAWNGRDWDTFVARHKPDVIVHWPGRSDSTRGQAAHRLEGIEMNKTFPDNHVGNRPYKVFFASGDWTCLVARFSGTMTGPMRGPMARRSHRLGSASRSTSAQSPVGTMGRSSRRTSSTTSWGSCSRSD